MIGLKQLEKCDYPQLKNLSFLINLENKTVQPNKQIESGSNIKDIQVWKDTITGESSDWGSSKTPGEKSRSRYGKDSNPFGYISDTHF